MSIPTPYTQYSTTVHGTTPHTVHSIVQLYMVQLHMLYTVQYNSTCCTQYSTTPHAVHSTVQLHMLYTVQYNSTCCTQYNTTPQLHMLYTVQYNSTCCTQYNTTPHVVHSTYNSFSPIVVGVKVVTDGNHHLISQSITVGISDDGCGHHMRINIHLVRVGIRETRFPFSRFMP